VYVVMFTDDAVGNLRVNLSRSERNALKEAFAKDVAKGPCECSVDLVEPLAGYRSYHFREHRVVFRVFEARKLVVVVGVGKKGPPQEIYARLERLASSGKLADTVLTTLRMFKQ
jgi:mRNA-degrading endonuclease RelE of RelBE toxin-antitoxin system